MWCAAGDELSSDLGTVMSQTAAMEHEINRSEQTQTKNKQTAHRSTHIARTAISSATGLGTAI